MIFKFSEFLCIPVCLTIHVILYFKFQAVFEEKTEGCGVPCLQSLAQYTLLSQWLYVIYTSVMHRSFVVPVPTGLGLSTFQLLNPSKRPAQWQQIYGKIPAKSSSTTGPVFVSWNSLLSVAVKALTTLVDWLALTVGWENGPEQGLKNVSFHPWLPVI